MTHTHTTGINVDIYMLQLNRLFTDFNQAFDIAIRHTVVKEMRKTEVPEKVV